MRIENEAAETATVVLEEGSQSGDEQNEIVEAGDKKPKTGPEAQPDGKAGSVPPAQKAEALRDILKREKDDPNVKFTDAELDILDEHYSGKLQPAKGKKAAPPAKVEPEGEEAEAEAETETEGEEAEAEAETETEGEAAPDEDAAALMKEVGAKSLKDALAKVKQLRALTGNRTSQQVVKLERQIQSEKALMDDVAKGVPAALEHFAKVYPGIKLATSRREAEAPPEGRTAPKKGQRVYIAEDAFIDPDSAKLANDALRARDAEIDELRGHVEKFNTERERNRQDTALQLAQNHVVDEMVQVAQGMPTLKSVTGLREAIAAWYAGKPDARMEAFNDLFEIAQAEGCSLKAAALIKRGRDADRLVAEAEANGRKSAYGHKPNPSLSGQQGGKGEKTTYQNLTDAQLEAMSSDHRLIPQDWFDSKDNLDKNKIPKRAWGWFGLT